MGRLFRTLATASALAIGMGAAVVVSSPTASAESCRHYGHILHEAGAIKADAYAVCRYPDLGEILIFDDPSNIQRYDANNGYWYTLVSGSGKISYTCVGTTTNTYRLSNGYIDRQVTANCG